MRHEEWVYLAEILFINEKQSCDAVMYSVTVSCKSDVSLHSLLTEIITLPRNESLFTSKINVFWNVTSCSRVDIYYVSEECTPSIFIVEEWASQGRTKLRCASSFTVIPISFPMPWFYFIEYWNISLFVLDLLTK